MLQRRDFQKTSAAVTSALALANAVRAQASKLLRFVPQGNLSGLDVVAGTQYEARSAAFLVGDRLYQAWRNSVSGVVKAPFPVFWGVQKANLGESG